ncbi:hypothetical protein FJT64_016603 [Amphibalanus amphitrite]|uniref:Uncharacterized protein n=1 Tax=Amphibalanus amphitrite TaxID=1232801 RepID=A0A6A4XE71_AMPAM|nr:hypothetical protein FJT64_016603 [Amphibalanus amphitrite]
MAGSQVVFWCAVLIALATSFGTAHARPNGASDDVIGPHHPPANQEVSGSGPDADGWESGGWQPNLADGAPEISTGGGDGPGIPAGDGSTTAPADQPNIDTGDADAVQQLSIDVADIAAGGARSARRVSNPLISEEEAEREERRKRTRFTQTVHGSNVVSQESADFRNGTFMADLYSKENPWLQKYAPFYYPQNPLPTQLNHQPDGPPPVRLRQVHIGDTVLVPPKVQYSDQVLRTIHDAKLRSLPKLQEHVHIGGQEGDEEGVVEDGGAYLEQSPSEEEYGPESEAEEPQQYVSYVEDEGQDAEYEWRPKEAPGINDPNPSGNAAQPEYNTVTQTESPHDSALFSRPGPPYDRPTPPPGFPIQQQNHETSHQPPVEIVEDNGYTNRVKPDDVIPFSLSYGYEVVKPTSPPSPPPLSQYGKPKASTILGALPAGLDEESSEESEADVDAAVFSTRPLESAEAPATPASDGTDPSENAETEADRPEYAAPKDDDVLDDDVRVNEERNQFFHPVTSEVGDQADEDGFGAPRPQNVQPETSTRRSSSDLYTVDDFLRSEEVSILGAFPAPKPSTGGTPTTTQRTRAAPRPGWRRRADPGPFRAQSALLDAQFANLFVDELGPPLRRTTPRTRPTSARRRPAQPEFGPPFAVLESRADHGWPEEDDLTDTLSEDELQSPPLKFGSAFAAEPLTPPGLLARRRSPAAPQRIQTRRQSTVATPIRRRPPVAPRGGHRGQPTPFGDEFSAPFAAAAASRLSVTAVRPGPNPIPDWPKIDQQW